MRRPFVLGLTGSIGMGKSTTAAMFRDAGVPVWDADAVVSRLYAPGGGAAEAIAALCPDAVGPGGVDRERLKAWLVSTPGALLQLEDAVHPLVAADRSRFLAEAEAAGEPLVVLDHPLLFETGDDADTDATLVVTAPPEEQRTRVLARPGMTEAAFVALTGRQMADAEKCRRATHVMVTDTLDNARRKVRDLVAHLRGDGKGARGQTDA